VARMSEKEAIRCGLISGPPEISPQEALANDWEKLPPLGYRRIPWPKTVYVKVPTPTWGFSHLMFGIIMWLLGFFCALMFHAT